MKQIRYANEPEKPRMPRSGAAGKTTELSDATRDPIRNVPLRRERSRRHDVELAGLPAAPRKGPQETALDHEPFARPDPATVRNAARDRQRLALAVRSRSKLARGSGRGNARVARQRRTRALWGRRLRWRPPGRLVRRHSRTPAPGSIWDPPSGGGRARSVARDPEAR